MHSFSLAQANSEWPCSSPGGAVGEDRESPRQTPTIEEGEQHRREGHTQTPQQHQQQQHLDFNLSSLQDEISAQFAREREISAQVRKTPSWPRSWANFSLLSLYSHWNAWANWHLLGQPDTFLAAPAVRDHAHLQYPRRLHPICNPITPTTNPKTYTPAQGASFALLR